MKRVIVGILMLSLHLYGGLQYLIRSTPPETAFEHPTHDFEKDYETSGYTCDDAVDRNVPLGFTFRFNNTDYTHVNINSNGKLYFDNANDTSYSNTYFPDSQVDQAIYPYWDDLNMGDCNDRHGSIRYETFGTAPNRRFVVSWEGVPHFQFSGSYTFQVVLYEDGSIRFRYDANSDADGSSATIGVQEDPNHYDQYSYNQTIDPHKDVLYTPAPPMTDNDYTDYHFDELYYDGSDNEIKDSHGPNHGKGHNTPVVKGKICNAIDLSADSKNDYAILPARILDGAHDFTIAVWHKADPGTDSNALLSGARKNEDNAILFWMTNQTRFNGHLDNEHHGIDVPNISDGHWHHLVWRKHGRESCFFFDGVKQGCRTYNQNYTIAIESLILGQDQDSVGDSFDKNQDWEGIVDELLIFRRALSDSEIQTGYANQNAGKNWDGTPRTCPYPSITKTSCVLSDPVNGTTNPKRIPGATIRYAIQVDNPNTKETSDTVATDFVDDSHFDTSTIRNLRIANGVCNCENPGSTSPSGPNGTGDGVNPVKLDFGTVPGNSKKCGYFEVNLK